jgi:uncharacterized protein RhaS with RHS repeats
VTGVTTPNNETYTAAYDALGRASITDPLGRSAQFRYDARGLLFGVTPAGIAAS